MKTSLTVISFAVCMFAASVAFAQYQPQPPPPPPPGGGGYGPPPPGGGYGPPPPASYHQGFMIGFSIGGGAQVPDCENCEAQSGLAFDFSIGGFLNPNLALMYDVNAVMNFEEGFGDEPIIVTNSANTFAAQFWVAPQVWLKGGIGFGRLFISGEGFEAQSETGLALTAAVGYELMVSGNFGLDLQLRLSPVIYSDDVSDESVTVTNTAILIGFNWY